ncbi:MAG: glycosyl hydrolase family 25 [Prevotella sp.]|nr:glycosyl hydrolase family 25 [Prevotella sp.]
MQKKINITIMALAVTFTLLLAGYAWYTHKPQTSNLKPQISNLNQLLAHRHATIDSALNVRRHFRSEMAYYLRTHLSDDDEYALIARRNRENDSIINCLLSERQTVSINPFRKSAPVVRDLTIIAMGGYWNLKGWHHGMPPQQRGLLFDEDGAYEGKVDELFWPVGLGTFRGYDGSIYEGEWVDGRRHGNGYQLTPGKNIQVGAWLANVYKGERLKFTEERIYGIDISRHQHDIEGHYYPINWKTLRITSLGVHNDKNVVGGKTDYPISFIYIKATEGTTITNSYYSTDYKQARAHRFRTGAYHFYSTTSPAAEQARHFLATAIFSHGDLPPVLDIEPSDEKVTAMGGKEKLLDEVRIWLEVVEQTVGVRPILYVNQHIINTYFDTAPDLLRDYPVWMARYSEYMPNVKLDFWQLSMTGIVTGITKRVDIDVFNGYREQWQTFINTQTIP